MGQKNTLGGLKAAFFVGHFHCWLIAYFVYTCHFTTSGCGSQSFVDFFQKKITGKSLSEALIFASTNPQYDDRLFIELQVQYMKITSSEHGENMLCT